MHHARSLSPLLRRLGAALLVAGTLLVLRPAPAEASDRPLRLLVDDDDAPSGGSGSRRGGPFGLGLILGEPTGITAKFFFAHFNALQLEFGYGYDADSRNRAVLCVDYLFHFVDAIPAVQRAGRFVPYVGVGARLGIRSGDALLGVRVPLGLAFLIAPAPVEVFVEFALGVGLVPETVALFDGGLGGRFYF